MKNKKLFAILTLVCFMFTLMPMAAFAADNRYVGVAGDDSYTTYVDQTVTVGVYENETTTASGVYYYWAVDSDDDVVALSTAGEFKFDAVGTYYVYAVEATNGVQSIFGGNYTKAYIVSLIKDRYDDNIIDDCLTVKVKKNNTAYKLVAEGLTNNTVAISADNGWSGEGEVTVKLVKNNTTEDLNCYPSSRQTKKYKVFVPAGENPAGLFMLPAYKPDTSQMVL